MMKNTGYILALCLTASEHALAHDVWIRVNRQRTTLPQRLVMVIISPQRAQFLTEGISLKIPGFITGKR